MDRGIIVGGGLIAASFLVAVLLNRSAHEEAAPTVIHPAPPVSQVCESTRLQTAQPLKSGGIPDDACDRARSKPVEGTGPAAEHKLEEPP